jgi:hypothetical protein
VTHLEYIRSCRELAEKGLYVELGGYQCHAFLDWKFVNSSEWGIVNSALNGAGVESVQAKWEEMFAVKARPVQRRREEVISGKGKVSRGNATEKKAGKESKPVRKKRAGKANQSRSK